MVKSTQAKEELKLQARIIKWAKPIGVYSVRFYFGPGAEAGWPDVLFLIPGGRPLYIEFKWDGEPPNAKQERKINLLLKLDYDVCICDNDESAKSAISRALERAQLSGAGVHVHARGRQKGRNPTFRPRTWEDVYNP